MKITIKWLTEKNACGDAVKAWQEKGCEPDPIKIIGLAMEMNRFDWATWLIVRVMSYRQYVSYTVFAAEQVIDIYEAKYPNDYRPRNAIAAAKKCLTQPTAKNKAAAWAAAGAAEAAWAARAAAWAARAAAWAAGDAAGDEIRRKIIEYGITLLKGE